MKEMKKFKVNQLKIEISFYLTVEEEKQARAERGMKLIAKHCPVIQSLNPSIEVIEKQFLFKERV